MRHDDSAWMAVWVMVGCLWAARVWGGCPIAWWEVLLPAWGMVAALLAFGAAVAVVRGVRAWMDEDEGDGEGE